MIASSSNKASATPAVSAPPASARGAPPASTVRAARLFLDNQLCFALYSASLAMTRVYRPLLKPLGLTYPQYVVMLALWEHGELSVGALGRRVSLDSGTLVPLIRKLSARALVERHRSAVDDRSVLISVTPAGRKLRERAQAVHDRVACAAQCSADRCRELAGELHSLRAALLGEPA